MQVVAADEITMGQLFKVMQMAYRTESVPEEWQKGVINPIFKRHNPIVTMWKNSQ